VLDDLGGVFLELFFLVRSAAGDPPVERILRLVLLDPLLERAVADRLVARNSTSRIFSFGPSPTMNVTLISLGPPFTGVTLWLTSALVNPFSAINSRSTPSTRRMVPSSRNESRRSSIDRSRSLVSMSERLMMLMLFSSESR
jgi:hypothetical protein